MSGDDAVTGNTDKQILYSLNYFILVFILIS